MIFYFPYQFSESEYSSFVVRYGTAVQKYLASIKSGNPEGWRVIDKAKVQYTREIYDLGHRKHESILYDVLRFFMDDFGCVASGTSPSGLTFDLPDDIDLGSIMREIKSFTHRDNARVLNQDEIDQLLGFV